jgi:hypothetical protein
VSKPDDEDFETWVAAVHWPELWGEEDSVNDWAIDSLLPAGRQVALWARAKTGKSLLLLDIAAAAATGSSVLGQPGRDPIDVSFFDLEMGRADLRDRLTSLGYGPESDLKRLHYYQDNRLPKLDTPLGGSVLCAAARHDNAQVVFIDPLSRAVAGEENSSDTYRNFQQYTAIPLRALGIGLVCADHGGKDSRQGQRGSSAKQDLFDVVFELSRSGNLLALRCSLSRVPWVAQEMKVKRETEPRLRHVLEAQALLEGTIECATALDAIGVPLDASRRVAETALRDAGQGRGSALVSAALKYRRRQK